MVGDRTGPCQHGGMSDPPARPPIWPPPPGWHPPPEPHQAQAPPPASAPPGWQPPSWPPPPGTRTGPRWYVIAGIIAGVVALVVAAAIVFVPRVVRTVLGPRTGATLYLSALRNN